MDTEGEGGSEGITPVGGKAEPDGQGASGRGPGITTRQPKEKLVPFGSRDAGDRGIDARCWLARDAVTLGRCLRNVVAEGSGQALGHVKRW